MFESENRKLSKQNRKIEIGIIEAEIRIEATQLTRKIVTALVGDSGTSYQRPTQRSLSVTKYIIAELQ